jgi:hypothetical protein
MSTIILLDAFSFFAFAAYMGFVIARERRRVSGPMLLPVYVTTRQPPRRYA